MGAVARADPDSVGRGKVCDWAGAKLQGVLFSGCWLRTSSYSGTGVAVRTWHVQRTWCRHKLGKMYVCMHGRRVSLYFGLLPVSVRTKLTAKHCTPRCGARGAGERGRPVTTRGTNSHRVSTTADVRIAGFFLVCAKLDPKKKATAVIRDKQAGGLGRCNRCSASYLCDDAWHGNQSSASLAGMLRS